MYTDIKTVGGIGYTYALHIVVHHGSIGVLYCDVGYGGRLFAFYKEVLNLPATAYGTVSYVVVTYLYLLAFVCTEVNGIVIYVGIFS